MHMTCKAARGHIWLWQNKFAARCWIDSNSKSNSKSNSTELQARLFSRQGCKQAGGRLLSTSQFDWKKRMFALSSSEPLRLKLPGFRRPVGSASLPEDIQPAKMKACLDWDTGKMTQICIHGLCSCHAQQHSTQHDPSVMPMVNEKLEGPVWRDSSEDRWTTKKAVWACEKCGQGNACRNLDCGQRDELLIKLITAERRADKVYCANSTPMKRLTRGLNALSGWICKLRSSIVWQTGCHFE